VQGNGRQVQAERDLAVAPRCRQPRHGGRTVVVRAPSVRTKCNPENVVAAGGEGNGRQVVVWRVRRKRRT